MNMILYIIFNLLWIVLLFLFPIFQGYFATILYDEEGRLTVDLLIKSKLFWSIFGLWIVGNVCFLKNKASKEEDSLERIWMKDKAKLIDDTTKKAKRGDYSGATETMKIIHELNQIVREDK